ncbi:SDR family oxidoreductase [Amycolatopsis sp. NPDC023774]|uniref:SDR family oxidoreductase n=1 Tax=Amycolatopsis sp. NPDC023774 TaxID=3155015 RepID=UPI0033EEA2C2
MVAVVSAAAPMLPKGGLQAATKSLAVAYAGSGVRVNMVATGIHRTALNPPETYAERAGLHPLGRTGEGSAVFEDVPCLENATFVIGEILNVTAATAPPLTRLAIGGRGHHRPRPRSVHLESTRDRPHERRSFHDLGHVVVADRPVRPRPVFTAGRHRAPVSPDRDPALAGEDQPPPAKTAQVPEVRLAY